jgi:hypothetical protein
VASTITELRRRVALRDQRIATLEAALEKATKEIGGWSGRETEDLYEQCRAALAGAPEREEK